MTFLATGFQESDLDGTRGLIACLEAIRSHPFFGGVKSESYGLLQLNPGDRLLDIGCGTGSDAWRLSGLTGPHGLVAAIDPGLSMLKEAQKGGTENRFSSELVESPSFIRMDGRHLGFCDSVFDGVREDRALQHISNPSLVLCEMIRVLKPGGRFVLFEPDWELFILENPAREVTRKILNYWADQFMNGWVGRELYRMCLDCGALDVIVLPRTMVLHDLASCDLIFGIRDTVSRACGAGIINREEGAEWVLSLEETDRTGRFFSSFTGYLVSGKKS